MVRRNDRLNDPLTGRDILGASPQASDVEFHDGVYPYKKKMKRSKYEKLKIDLQVELLKLESWVRDTGQRVVILFEGRDAAGKGGTIRRFMEHMNPRHSRVVALPIPSAVEKGQWYFQRYVQHLPTAGELVLFDRSWYNRVGVEKVMGFCTSDDYLEFTRQAPVFERLLVESGTRLIKLYFSVGRQEQYKRFQARKKSPLKRWKLSPVDEASLKKWEEYTEAKRMMFFYTDTADAPWFVVKADDKKRARIEAMRLVLTALPYAGKDLTVVRRPDPLIVGRASDVLEYDADITEVAA